MFRNNLWRCGIVSRSQRTSQPFTFKLINNDLIPTSRFQIADVNHKCSYYSSLTSMLKFGSLKQCVGVNIKYNCYSTTPEPTLNSKDLSAIKSLTNDEATKILKLVNEVQRSEDLLKYIIPKKRADELVKRKNAGQSELTLEEVVSIVGPKNSSRFFCSVLEKPIPISANAAMFPVLPSEEIKRISNVLSLVIVGDKISWTLVERLVEENEISLHVKSMHQISYQFKPRMHFLTLLQEMKSLVGQLPECDLYIVEEYPTSVPTPYMFTFQLQMATARSTLISLLSSRPNSSIITSIKTVAVARIFNTFIGNEKVSGQQIVDNLLYGDSKQFINISESVLEYYTEVESKVKEGLSQAFLLNLAYWKLSKQVKA